MSGKANSPNSKIRCPPCCFFPAQRIKSRQNRRRTGLSTKTSASTLTQSVLSHHSDPRHSDFILLVKNILVRKQWTMKPPCTTVIEWNNESRKKSRAACFSFTTRPSSTNTDHVVKQTDRSDAQKNQQADWIGRGLKTHILHIARITYIPHLGSPSHSSTVTKGKKCWRHKSTRKKSPCLSAASTATCSTRD